MKQWREQEARRRGVCGSAVAMDIARGKYPNLTTKHVNRRVVFVCVDGQEGDDTLLRHKALRLNQTVFKRGTPEWVSCFEEINPDVQAGWLRLARKVSFV